MLKILEKRLLDGMEIKKVKEWKSKYDITFLINGKEVKSELTRYCALGYENSVVDSVMFNAMARAAFDRGDIEDAKRWLDRDSHRLDERVE